MSHIIAPSILSADFANLAKDIHMINNSRAGWIHVDIMDGVFVPNISMGIPVVQAIAKHATKPLDVHLMIVNPSQYIEAFRDAGAALISVHLEADLHVHRTLSLIRELGCKAGVAINPQTPLSTLEHLMEVIDLVCLMAVNPGYGGQSFIENTYTKLTRLKDMIKERNLPISIEVDGGVNRENAPRLIKAGADVLVAGNAVFLSGKPQEAIAQLSAMQ